MAAVLSMPDVLRKDRHMSMDEFPPDTNWREKYNEVVDMLTETRAELDDFHQASKELEAELENELQRTEKAQRDLQAKAIRAENERDEWKNKFMSLQTTHNTTTTSLQRELDQLRQEYQKTKVYIRELEMGNDDLERNERAVSSSLADMESKYSRVLEEKILLEHELLEKAGLEEETQRLKDELRDANVEISILKDQLAAAHSRQNSKSKLESPYNGPSTENLLKTAPPPNLDSSDDVSPSSEETTPYPDKTITTPKASLSRPAVPVSFMTQTVVAERPSPHMPLKTTTNIIRSSSQPLIPSPASARSLIRPPVTRTPSILSTSSTGSLAKNKGVQMVSEMRARVRNLEQKIHTRVPRLRMASLTGRQSITSNNGTNTPVSSSSSVTSNSSTAKTSWESQRKSVESRRSNDSVSDKRLANKDDTAGWVLIMEDPPSPHKDKEKRTKDRRRLSNPSITPLFRSSSSTIRAASPSLSTGFLNSGSNSLAISTGLRLPKSRLSGGNGVSPSLSRPQTPTFLPVPSGNLQASTSGISLKRSTGPNAPNAYNSQLKRSSVGRSNVTPPVPPLPPAHRARPITMPPLKYRRDSGASSPLEARDLPALPESTTNVTMRSTNRIPSSTSTTSGGSALSKSRIGRPSGSGMSGRRSGGSDVLDISDLQPRSDTAG